MSGTEPHITLRPQRDEDEAFVFAVFAVERQAQFNTAGLPDAAVRQLLETQYRAQQAHYRAQFPGADFDLVLVDDSPVGYLYVLRHPERVVLIDVALLPDCRGRGIGTTLVDALLREAAVAALPVVAHVLKQSRAWRFWQRLGFNVVADDGVHLSIERRP